MERSDPNIPDQKQTNGAVSSFFRQTVSYSCGNSVRFSRTSLLSGCLHPAPERKKNCWKC